MPKHIPVSEQIRRAIDASPMSRYRICREADFNEASMSRFMHGQAGLSTDALDRIGRVLDLRVVADPPPERKTKRRS